MAAQGICSESLSRRTQAPPNGIADRAHKLANTRTNRLALDRCRANIAVQEMEYACSADAPSRGIDRTILHAAIRSDHEHGRNGDAAHLALVVQVPCPDDLARGVAKKRKR